MWLAKSLLFSVLVKTYAFERNCTLTVWSKASFLGRLIGVVAARRGIEGTEDVVCGCSAERSRIIDMHRLRMEVVLSSVAACCRTLYSPLRVLCTFDSRIGRCSCDSLTDVKTARVTVPDSIDSVARCLAVPHVVVCNDCKSLCQRVRLSWCHECSQLTFP